MNTTYQEGRRYKSATQAMIRPAWTPATIGLMIIGFMVFWPLGLAMLAYVLWGDRLDTFKDDVNRKTDRAFGFCRGERGFSRTGNVAFDDWREAEISRIEEERRKLDTMRQEFDEHLRELHRARDQKEFDEFMKAYNARSKSGKDDGKTSGVPKV